MTGALDAPRSGRPLGSPARRKESRLEERRARPRSSVLAPAGLALLLTSCSESAAPSALEPQGPGAERVAGLWWLMFGISTAVVLVVAALIVIGAVRRRRRADGDETPRWAMGMVIGGGVVFPILVLALLWALTLRDVAFLDEPPSEPTVRIEVIGKRWWWDVRYPDQDVVTANEIHVPVGETVDLLLRSGDIIHSFWVPELMPKTDMIPGRDNQMWLRADRPGTYRGQCAEFCGLQHARMAFLVIAEPRDEFDAWLQDQAAEPPAPPDPEAEAGLQAFLSSPCVGCHTIRGTEASGTLGPDLTHVASRRTLAAATIPNTPENLLAWITNSQRIKPGNLMPPIELPSEDLQAIVAYLETLE
jgi:cytochrome c oxidase subunit 2